MKKMILVLIAIIILLFISKVIMIRIDNKYFLKIDEMIKNNTDIKNIDYINEYDGYYIIKNNGYIFLLNSNFEEITKIKLNLVYENKNNYDIVYRNKTIMYMNNYKNKEGIIFRYYDIYTYELIDEIVVGGYYE